MICIVAECAREVHARGRCERHYNRGRRMGVYGWADPAPAREHIARLRELSWTWEQIAAAAGTCSAVPHRIATGRTHRLWRETARALVAIPLVPIDSRRGVDSTGSRRRVQGLAWMAWPSIEVARRASTTQGSLQTSIMAGRRLSSQLATRIAVVYDELSMTTGPAPRAAAVARRLGFAPPMAWDDDQIDDPAAEPHMGIPLGVFLDLDEVRHLRAGGCSDEEIARRMNVTPAAIERAQFREKRLDSVS